MANIDLTTRPIGSKWRGQVIARCPKCGRPGAWRQGETIQRERFWICEHVYEAKPLTLVDRCGGSLPS